MKKYIFFCWAGAVGGAQIYLYNKCKVIEKHGYMPIIFHGGSDYFLIDYFKTIKTKHFHELLDYPARYSYRERQKLLCQMEELIDRQDDDELFIESNGVFYSYWAELLAKKMRCGHFIFLLEGSFNKSSINQKYFLNKLEIGQLAGTRQASLQQIFRDQVVNDSNNLFYAAYCTNSVEEVEDKLNIDFTKYDFKICNFGQDYKPYTRHIIAPIADFCRSHPKSKILFMMLGGEKESAVSKLINEIFSDVPNADIVITGRMFPVPALYFRVMDAVIASSGSILISLRYAKKTIAYHDAGEKSSGVLGYDLLDRKNVIDNEKYILTDLLEKIFQNEYDNRQYVDLSTPFNTEKMNSDLWNDTLDMQKRCEVTPQYYNTSYYSANKIMKIFRMIIGDVVPGHYICRIVKIAKQKFKR